MGAVLLSMNYFTHQLNENTFDFWVGNWELTWVDAKGNTIKGENIVVKTLGNKVIEENFSDPTNNYTGKSISIFNTATNSWHQTWMDSQGSHFNFTGEIVDGNPSFKTAMVEKEGQMTQQRMVFKNLKKDSFTWVWEGTKDGGENWATLWKIAYKRK